MVARKTSENPTKIYSYGVRRCFQPPQIVVDLLKRSVIYYNQLIALENSRREQFTELELASSCEIRAANDSVVELESAFEEVSQRIRDSKKASRKSKVPDDLKDLKAATLASLKAARDKLKELKQAHRLQNQLPDDERLRRTTCKLYNLGPGTLKELSGDELRKRVNQLKKDLPTVGPRIIERVNADVLEEMLSETWDESWKQVRRLESGSLLEHKKQRGDSNLPNGTYLLTEASVEAARKKVRGGPLRRKWVPGEHDPIVDTSGRVGVQLQGGLLLHRLLSDDGNAPDPRLHLEIESLPEHLQGRSKNWVKLNTRATVRMKVDSDGTKKPVHIDIPISYHRPIPPGSNIKWAWLIAFRSGRQVRYQVQFSLETFPDLVLAPSKSVCAINLGWRSLTNGTIRVGTLAGSDGVVREFCLDKGITDRLGYANVLRGIRDTVFDGARAVVASVASGAESKPEWFDEFIEHIKQWRAHQRLHALCRRLSESTGLSNQLKSIWIGWKEQRLESKLDLMPEYTQLVSFCESILITDTMSQLAVYLSFWCMKDNHLWDWETNQRSRCLGHRTDTYRVWAKWISEHYETVVFEDEGLDDFARKEEEADPGAGFRRERAKAAPSHFKLAVVSKIGKKRTGKVKSKLNTTKCSFCGHLNDWDTKNSVSHVCGGCGRTIDQDHNNALNQLRIALEGPSDSNPSDAARGGKKSAKKQLAAAAE